MSAPTSLRLPHPRGRASITYVLLVMAAAWAGGMLGTLGAMALLAILGVKGSTMIWGLLGAPLGMVLGWRVVRALWRPSIQVRRAGRTVLGLVAPLQAEEGWLRIRAFMSGGKNPQPRYELSHHGERGSLVLFNACPEPGLTRDVAEAICKLGGFDMEWIALGGASELRPVSELDLPLADRLRKSPHLLRAPEGAERASLEMEALPDGGIRIPVPAMSVGRLLTFLTASWGSAALLGLGGVRDSTPVGYLPVFLIAGGGLTILCVLWFLGSWLVRHELDGSPAGIRHSTRVFGVRIRSRLASAAMLEEVFVESRYEDRLVLVGDGFFWPMPAFEGGVIRSVRYHLLRALVGQRGSSAESRAA